MATLNNSTGQITFQEKSPESPDEAWGMDASRTRRTYVIDGDAENRFLAARSLLGYATLKQAKANGNIVYYVSRQVPHNLPYKNQGAGANGGANDVDKGVVFLYAQAITRTTPVGVGGAQQGKYAGLSKYTKAFVEVEYRTTSYDVRTDDYVKATEAVPPAKSPLFDLDAGVGYPDEGDGLRTAPAFAAGAEAFSASRYITRVFRPGTRFLTLRSGMMTYLGDTAVVPEGVPITEPFVDCQYTWHAIPAGAYPASAIQKALGAVNDATFDGFAEGTLLFTGVLPLPGRSPFGDKILDVQYTFKYCPKISNAGAALGHNAVYRTTGGIMDYAYVTSDGTLAGRFPYRSVDFCTLFRPDQI